MLNPLNTLRWVIVGLMLVQRRSHIKATVTGSFRNSISVVAQSNTT